MTELIPTLPELDVADLGPAMRALSPRQRNFVVGKVFYGLDNTNAAHAAGYSPLYASSNACHLAHREDVQQAIEEECRKLMKSEGPKSILTLVQIRDGQSNKAADRIKASTELLNRAGLHAISESHTHVHAHVSEAEADRRILAFLAERGVPPDVAQKMLVQPDDFAKNSEGIYELAEPAPLSDNPAPLSDDPAPLSDNPTAVAKRQTRRRRVGMTPEELAADKAKVEAERVERLRRERAAFDARREGTVIDVEEANTATIAEPEVW